MKHRPLILAALLLSLIGSIVFGLAAAPAKAAPVVKAFPGAIGFGANTLGGRGGKVIYVTNLNDSGSGSLREALSATGARTVVFKVAGTINLQNDLNISQPFVTIAGQTAPGQGVQIKGGMIKIDTHDVIIRYLKVRQGNPTGGSPADTDSISILGNRTEVYNVVIDHCTLIWGTDIGGMSILTRSRDVTVQDTILGEGLNMSDHPEAPHSMSLNLTQLNDTGYPTRITLYRNLITSSDSRNPQIIQAASVDMVNNVIYNWGKKSAYGNPKSLNLVNNYYVKGPQSVATYFWDLRVDADYPTQNNTAVYEAGNVAVGFTGNRSGPSSIYSASPRFTTSVPGPMSALDAYNYVVANVGANRPVRDVVDQRIISNLTSRTMKLPNGASNRFINDTDLVWPTLASGAIPADNDNDGMADSWEQQYFGNTTKGSASSSASDTDGDGYTDLEEYLNGTNPVDGSGTTVPAQPTATSQPTKAPTLAPTLAPTKAPTLAPTKAPTLAPTAAPTLAPTAAPTQAPTAAPTVSYLPTVLKFTPSDDATVLKDKPASNLGKESKLLVDESPIMDYYMKFNVTGVSGRKVTKAVLRVFCVDGSSDGGKIKFVPSNNWSEGSLTWQNKPDSPDGAIASLGRVNSGRWYEVDVTSAVTGDGTFSFRGVTNSTDGADYSSKEGSNAPQLIVSVAP